MLDARPQDAVDMLIIKRVVRGSAVLTLLNEMQISQHPKMVADLRLAHIQDFRNVAHAELTLRKRPDDLDARRIPESLKRFGEQDEHLLRLELPCNALPSRRVLFCRAFL